MLYLPSERVPISEILCVTPLPVVAGDINLLSINVFYFVNPELIKNDQPEKGKAKKKSVGFLIGPSEATSDFLQERNAC